MQHEYQRVPITALAFLKHNIILSGEGPYLNVYDTDLGVSIKKLRTFETQAIHGIIVLANEGEEHTIFVWGASFARVLSIYSQDTNVGITLRETLTAGDWILDAAFSPSTEFPLVAVVTAHNAISTILIPLPSPSTQHAQLTTQVKGDNTILYSAHITWLNTSQCLIATGTAFGDISVWSAFFDDRRSCIRTETYFTFSAHEGSLFGVRLSSQLSIDGFGCERLLASCSDDRTIRIWDVSKLSSTRRQTDAAAQRDTGFGMRVGVEDSSARKCIAKAMGHISRIWYVRFSPGREQGEVMRVLSFGEDATVITWALSLDTNGHSYSLNQLNTTRPHAGKNIWAVATSAASKTYAVATGGADGAMALLSTSRPVDQTADISQSLLSSSDNFRAYDFIALGVLVATTNEGRILLVDVTAGNDKVEVTEISPRLDGLKGYSFVSSIPGVAFVGGIDGTVYAYTKENKRLQTLGPISGKIAGLFPCNGADGGVVLLVTGVGGTSAELFSLEREGEIHGMHGKRTRAVKLDIPSGFVTTSFAYYAGGGRDYLVLGSRQGSLLLISFSDNMMTAHQKLYPEVHGKDAITALHWHHQRQPSITTSEPQREANWLLSTGRDGTFAIHALSLCASSGPEIQLAHQLSLPFGPNIEGLHLDAGCDILAWGFKSKNFILYDLLSQREVMIVECGGAHRNWSFQPGGLSNSKSASFAWTKASKMFYSRECSNEDQGPWIRLLNSGGHGREIKAMAVEQSLGIIATGAEDTDIKLFALTASEDRSWQCLQTLKKHNTGIQALAWYTQGKTTYLFSSAGFEEFYVWRITTGVACVEGGVGVYCESSHPRSGMSDLRIMDFHVTNYNSGGIDQSEEVLWITMAYSDSTVKAWTYDTRSQRWELCAQGNYLTYCLTHVFPLPVCSPLVQVHDAKPESTVAIGQFLTTATDGHLALWRSKRSQKELKWMERWKIHQSAIHAVAACTLRKDDDGDAAIVITGGDDNAISITILREQDRKLHRRTLVIPRAHAAAVTGMAFLQHTIEEGGCCFASVGLDQRVKLWTVSIDLEGDEKGAQNAVDVVLLGDVFTAVSDASGVEIWDSENETENEDGGRLVRAVVYGVGVETWRISLPAPGSSGYSQARLSTHSSGLDGHNADSTATERTLQLAERNEPDGV